jgi:hypothetical protein
MPGEEEEVMARIAGACRAVDHVDGGDFGLSACTNTPPCSGIRQGHVFGDLVLRA